ncbi:HNH endonuclease [Mycolicibacterium sp. P1-18]|uniref:HNH endonuclease signature motif containing protein n=1 Tax=Mycolicibacterium sp. P1-18 TaxID=2024615 RepID=UPI0011F2A2D6|nr:HNH endonuclease signature motif containing protein [Mycolicibacterium sp. P1-18]KAA0093143.1 HNH endonuclease [Mycolicibacterium sp. P1-18]
MPSTATPMSSKERLEVLFGEMEELAGQRNAIDSRLVEIAAEIEGDGIWGATGCRSVPALVAWKLGTSPHTAETIVTVARRLNEFPRCAAMMREGQLSLDQVGVIAERAGEGSDEHYAQLASVATVTQLRFAIKLEPRPKPDPRAEPERSLTKTVSETHTTYRIRLPKVEAAKFEAGLDSHRDALVAAWKRDHDGAGGDDGRSVEALPFPNATDAFMSLVEAGWDADVARRPHGQHTTVVVHLDVENRKAALHLGPFLSDADRRNLMCEADCEIWFERHGQVIGSGRATRQISRRLRRALEHRDRCCVVPGCGATRGLHAHHIRHWEDGGPTELGNLVLLCPFHHRLHHSGGITITGPASHLVVTDADGEPLQRGSLVRTPTRPPPAVKPCRGPLGERAEWWWYTPFEPQPPPASTN